MVAAPTFFTFLPRRGQRSVRPGVSNLPRPTPSANAERLLPIAFNAPLPDDVVRRAQRGNRVAQRAVYDRYATTMFAISRRYASSTAEAEDFSQDAWVRVFEKMHTFNFEGSLEGWMRRVFATVALRGLEKRGKPLADFPDFELDDMRVDPDAIANLGAEELLREVDKLPAGYRMVFSLHAVDDLSHEQIGEALGISASTSRSQLTKAKRLLKQRLSTLFTVCL